MVLWQELQPDEPAAAPPDSIAEETNVEGGSQAGGERAEESSDSGDAMETEVGHLDETCPTLVDPPAQWPMICAYEINSADQDCSFVQRRSLLGLGAY